MSALVELRLKVKAITDHIDLLWLL
jgi:hypothetical protein